MEIELHPAVPGLLRQLQDLQQQTSRLLEREAHLRRHARPLLEAMYEKEIGVHELELLKVRIEVNELKFRIERLLAILNRTAGLTPGDLERLARDVEEARAHWRRQVEEKERLLKDSAAFLRTAEVLSPEETQRLKLLYRSLCLLLHPDLGRDPELHDRYWEPVQEAYAMADIQALDALLAAVRSAEGEGGLEEKSGLEVLQEKRDRLESLVLELGQRLQRMEESPPFCLQERLHDPAWLDARRKELAATTRAMAARRGELRDFYERILAESGLRSQ